MFTNDWKKPSIPKDSDKEITKIKVFICRDDAEPICIHQLSATGQDQFRALLRHLELFAEFLPYLRQHEEKFQKMNGEANQQMFQLRVTLANLRTAIELTTAQNEGVRKLVPILREHGS